MIARAERILDYWFGDVVRAPASLPERTRLWYQQSDATDTEIRREFEGDLNAAVDGKLEAWRLDPRSCLALIILLDQFSLNLYREEARSFDQSALAIPITLEAIAKGWDLLAPGPMRVFFYMPLEHAENLELQEKSVGLFRRLLLSAPEGQKASFESFLDYAIRHRDVVARFGRFPDRNEAYGRTPTAEEARYMAEGGVPF